MRSFEESNPIAVTVYFLALGGILMFSQSPVLLLLGALGAFGYSLVRSKRPSPRSYGLYLGLFLLLTAINPLFSHNGKTVLLVINDSPVTLEAVIYGAVSGGILVTVLCLLQSFSEIMTRDRLLYVFGALSPKLALVLSMGIRYVPLFRDRAKKISESQRALGLYKEDNILDKVKSDLRVFSILITWALENGITTADSMSARGYGRRRRTYFTLFKFRRSDAFVVALTLVCTAVTAVAMAFGALETTFYPTFIPAKPTPLCIAGYTAYGLLALLPIILETEEALRWNALRSRI